MDENLPKFQRTQHAFAAYIRDPRRHAVPADVAPVRMRMYRELFFNNIENFIASGFPVLKTLLEGERWRALVQDFFARHRNRTPLFVGIAEEFLDYLDNERGRHPEDPPFLRELAHYEWAELALAVAEGEPPSEDPDLLEDPLGRTVHLSEVAWPLVYRFPVHRIGPECQPSEPPGQPTCLVVYRDREDLVRFLETNPVTHRLLELLGERGPCSALDCLTRIAEELGHPEPQRVVACGADLLRGLVERGVIGGR
jgi:hypothetical protein